MTGSNILAPRRWSAAGASGTAEPTTRPALGLSRRTLLAGLAAGAAVGRAPARAQTGPAVAPPVAAPDNVPDIAPAEDWLPIDPAAALSRIGFGSCLDQRHPQPIWKSVLAAKPDLFLMIGDNVYGDSKSPDLAELVEAYRLQAKHPEFAAARTAVPMLAIWDDHDYGLNDGGAAYAGRELSARLFRKFWHYETEQPDDGVYYTRTIGPDGKRVQIIMLDTRSFRSEWKKKTDDFPYWGRYSPDPTPAKTILGERQWRWLFQTLSEPADVRLLVSSIQVLAEGHGHERWGNFPHERQRLIDMLRDTGANGVVILSGDRHAGAMYRLEGALRYPLVELTSSSLNRSYGPSKDERLPPLISGIYHPENFGLVSLDWEKRWLTIELKGMDGVVVTSLSLVLKDLGSD